MISNATIDKVIEATDIVDVVGEFVTLKKKGARYIGLCPFHDDRHATNFSVYPLKKCYKCFACEAKGGAVDFLMKAEGMSYPDAIRWLGRRVGIDVDDKDVRVEPVKRDPPPPLPTLYLPTKMVEQSMKRCNFHAWLHSQNWTQRQRERIEPVIEAYKVGATKKGWALFWQIDETGTARTGHAMKYHDDGHRVKDEEEEYNTDWVHAMLRREVVRDHNGWRVKDKDGNYIPKYPQYADDKVEMRQTLFGMHLLNRYPGAEVHIVESEKTALIAAIYFGEPEKKLWMACNGKHNLTAEKLKPIIDQRRVIAFHPDKDGVEEWKAQMEAISYNRAYLDNTILTIQWKPEDGPKADIADVLIRMMNEGRCGKTMKMGEVMALVPAIKKLIEKNGSNE